MIQKNDKGQVLVSLAALLIPAAGGFDFFKKGIKDTGNICWHYNGGWMRRVTGLDKNRDNGFSIQGEQVFKFEQQAWQTHGLFLDCCVEGSRKNPSSYYTLFNLREDGKIAVLATSKGSDWAVKLWPTIEAFFSVEDELIEATAPLTLWQSLDRALETEQGSIERQELLVMFPILGEIGLTDIRNLLDFTTAQDRAESGLNRHSRENAQFDDHLRTIKTALGAMQDLLERAQSGALGEGDIEFS